MVSVNVSQLLLMGPGSVREFEFCEPFPDPAGELHLRGPVSGYARLIAEHGWPADDVPEPQDPDTFTRSKLDWTELEREPHRGLLAWHRRLLALRRATPELRAGGPLSVEHSEAPRRLVMSRGPLRVDCDFESGRVAVEKLGKPLEWE